MQCSEGCSDLRYLTGELALRAKIAFTPALLNPVLLVQKVWFVGGGVNIQPNSDANQRREVSSALDCRLVHFNEPNAGSRLQHKRNCG